MQKKIIWQKSVPTYDKNRNRGEFPQLSKSIYQKPTANIIVCGERMNAFPLRLGTEQDVPSHPTYPVQC